MCVSVCGTVLVGSNVCLILCIHNVFVCVSMCVYLSTSVCLCLLVYISIVLCPSVLVF